MDRHRQRNVLYLVRGLPGAGKTTFINTLMVMFEDGCTYAEHFEADQFFYDDKGNYNFDASKLGAAHTQCQRNTYEAMESGADYIFVSNTFTTEKELKPYLDMAKDFPHYDVVSIVLENRHGHESVHNVPEETMVKMQDRFSLKLRG